MSRLLGIPDALRDVGLEPVEVAGWRTRGYEFDEEPIIHLRHWTAGPRTGKAPSLRLVTIGRPDLPGPLCQVLQERTGGTGLDRVYVVASGRANHAGVGGWAEVTSGNRRGTGNEIEWSGTTEPFDGRRKETSERVAAALLSLGPDPKGLRACEHREYAYPIGRKIDTNLSGPEFRLRVQQILNQGDDEVVTEADRKAIAREVVALMNSEVNGVAGARMDPLANRIQSILEQPDVDEGQGLLSKIWRKVKDS